MHLTINANDRNGQIMVNVTYECITSFVLALTAHKKKQIPAPVMICLFNTRNGLLNRHSVSFDVTNFK